MKVLKRRCMAIFCTLIQCVIVMIGLPSEAFAAAGSGASLPLVAMLGWLWGFAAVGIGLVWQRRCKWQIDQLTRTLAELNLKAAALASLNDAASDAILTVDAHGLIQSSNKRADAVFGYNSGTLSGRPFETIFAESLMPAGAASNEHLPVTDDGRRILGKTLGGALVPLQISTHEIAGQASLLFGVTLRNISDLVATEDALRLRTEQLERSNIELRQFASIAAHDLQEPLRRIVNFGQMLADEMGGKLPGQAEDYLKRMQDCARRGRSQVESLLTLTQIGQRKGSRQADCQAAFRQALDSLEMLVAERGPELEIDDLPPSVPVDSKDLERIFQNLLGNALKFAHAERQLCIAVRCRRHQDHWQVSVQDNGIGMRTEHLKQIFDPFQRLNRREQYPGHGLGLAICRRIVDAFGGRIWAESVPESGTSMHFTIPFTPNTEGLR